MPIHSLFLSKSRSEFNAHRGEAENALRDVFDPGFWGFDFECAEYAESNIQNIWTNELRSAVRKALENAGKTASDYSAWMGKIHFAAVAVYPKRLFTDYKSNVGWRITLLAVPAAGVLSVGVASHYQSGQKHNQLGLASNLLFDIATEGLSSAKEPIVLPGRKVTPDDWDKTGLILQPIKTVCDVDISEASPPGLFLKDVRTTTVKKIIASFVSIEPQTVTNEDSLAATLKQFEHAARRLAGDVHPFCDLGEFEYIRALALEDLAAARMRHELRRRSSTRSVVRVYYGPPGTGKTLLAVHEAVKLADPKFESGADVEKAFVRFNELHGQVTFVTFHQSLQYEDVMESIRPFVTTDAEAGANNSSDVETAADAGEKPSDGAIGDSFSDQGKAETDRLRYYVHQGPVMRIIRRASEHPHLEHVLVIDEINRGDISRVLGPLISAIEPDKRAGAEFPVGFESQYPRAPELETRIFVPPNLHIIGTMNSADRNIALVDHALRRRFDFVECPPLEALLPGGGEGRTIDLRLLLEAVNKRIRFLIDRDHCIGHGYFMSCKEDKDVVEAFARRILPLLSEYFFGNESQLLLALGDRIGAPYNIYKIERKTQTFEQVFGLDLETALDMGYREQESHISLSLDSRFWNAGRLIPGSDDEQYAIKALRKIYEPDLNRAVPNS